jgi:hypothetical protein
VRRLFALALLAVTAGAACSGDETPKALPERPPSEAAPSTSEVDLSTVELARVPGRTTTTVDQGPGNATLAGTVSGPDGVVAGATVRVERLVGDAVISIDVVTDAVGAWRMAAIKGGRYRVRAWRVPDLAQRGVSVFFLGATESRSLPLALARQGGIGISSSIAPNPPTVDEAANLVVLVTQREVDDQGIVRAAPLGGVSAHLAGSGDWTLDGENLAFTDGDGRASWQLTCRSLGSQPLSVVAAGETFALSIPDCVAAVAETTTTVSGDSSTPTAAATTTTSKKKED